MKMVIDIPEKVYTYIQREWEVYDFDSVVNHALNGIKNGTPLPKGHGRLIDADRVVAEATKRMKYPLNHQYMECVIAHMKLAPTIIEADKAESEDNEDIPMEYFESGGI